MRSTTPVSALLKTLQLNACPVEARTVASTWKSVKTDSLCALPDPLSRKLPNQYVARARCDTQESFVHVPRFGSLLAYRREFSV